MGRARHCSDEALLALGIVGEGEAAFHVARCPACAARYRELTGALQSDRDALAREADEGFPPEVAERQLRSIMHRVDPGRGAHVIAFPVQPRPLATPNPVARRTVAAAAAALLMIAVGLGALRLGFDVGVRPPHPLPQMVMRPLTPGPHISRADSADDELLSAVDALLARSKVNELQALDALTPRPAERSPAAARK